MHLFEMIIPVANNFIWISYLPAYCYRFNNREVLSFVPNNIFARLVPRVRAILLAGYSQPASVTL
jgi:hypothetical protein